MTNRPASSVKYGPWLVALGAALWGTESAWRIPLNNLFDAEVIVFWEHVLILLIFLPLLLMQLREIPRIDARTWGFLIFSGFAGSAVGTIFFTLALKHGNPTVVNVILNIQPVISTVGACLLFRDRLASRFYVFAAIAILAGVFLSVDHPERIGTSFEEAGLNLGTGFALICALFWGLSTVAGRGVMTGMTVTRRPYRVGSRWCRLNTKRQWRNCKRLSRKPTTSGQSASRTNLPTRRRPTSSSATSASSIHAT